MSNAILAEWREMFTPPQALQPPALEQAFRADYARRFARQRRAAIVLGALSWMAYLPWDLIHASMNADMALIRDSLVFQRLLGSVVLVVVAALSLGSWFEQDERKATALLISGNFFSTVLAYLMMRQVPSLYGSAFYFFGLLAGMVFAFGVLRLRALPIIGLMTVDVSCAGGMMLLDVFLQGGDRDAYVVALKLGNVLFSVGVIGVAFGNQLERTQRSNFLRLHELAQLNLALDQSRARFELVNQATSEGLWDMVVVHADPINPTNEFLWMDGFRHLLGFEGEHDFPNVLASWSERLHHEDRERVLAAFLAHIVDRSGQTPYDVEYRLLRKDGSYGWYRARGATQRDAQGQPLRVAGSLADISAQKHYETDLIQRNQELARYNETIMAHSREVEQLNEMIRKSSQEGEEKALALLALKDQMREDAERRNKEKSRFLATAVHDLKQPLQAISNALLPAQRSIEIHQYRTTLEMLELAQRAAHLMREQLSAILEISRLESGFVRAELSCFDLNVLLSEVLAQVADVARAEQVMLRLSSSADSPALVFSDRHFLGRILLNLLSNSIKYRDPNKTRAAEVQLRLSLMGQGLRLEVQDFGLGIAPEHLQDGAIFKPFYQVNLKRREGEKGVGLGLSIVRSMLALLPEHGLEVQSELGQGTTVTLDLPLGRAEQMEPALQYSARGEDESQGLAQLTGLYVLLVEDDDLVRISTCALLSARGALHESAQSFEELERLLPTMEREPDVVVTDYRLPEGRNAVDVLRSIERHWPGLPALVFTGEVLSEAAKLEIASAPLLRKPLPPHDLLQAIVRAAKTGLKS